MDKPDIIAAIEPVIDALEELRVPYSVVGSVASSAHGIARATLDADLVADLRSGHVESLVSALIDSYYIDKDAALDAVKRRAMFNVVHLATMLKVDIYVLTAREFDQGSFRRRGRARLDDATDAREFSLDTPEEIRCFTSSSGFARVVKWPVANGRTPSEYSGSSQMGWTSSICAGGPSRSASRTCSNEPCARVTAATGRRPLETE